MEPINIQKVDKKWQDFWLKNKNQSKQDQNKKLIPGIKLELVAES